jgi:hypothetical protein
VFLQVPDFLLVLLQLLLQQQDGLGRLLVLLLKHLQQGVKFTNTFGAKAEKRLKAMAFGKVLPKYATWSKSSSLKYARNFKQKCCWNRTASFVPLT